MIMAPWCLFGFRNLATSCGQIEKQGQIRSRNFDLLDELELFLLGFARLV